MLISLYIILIILISKFYYYYLLLIEIWLVTYILFLSVNLSCIYILVLYSFLFFCFPDHQSTPAVTDNEDNLLRNVSSCFDSLDIKQNLQGQDNKQSRKRQNNTTDQGNNASTSGAYVTGIACTNFIRKIYTVFVE